MNIHTHPPELNQPLILTTYETEKNRILSLKTKIDALIEKTKQSYEATPKMIEEFINLHMELSNCRIDGPYLECKGKLTPLSSIESPTTKKTEQITTQRNPQ